MFIENLAERHGIRLSRRSEHALWGKGVIRGKDVVLMEPMTFMNMSGRAVAAFLRKFEIVPRSLLVAYDDCDLPPGTMRIRPGGGSGGHRGLASVIEALGTDDFPRLRLGIGRPDKGDLTGHVLSNFGPDEHEALEGMLGRALSSVELLLEEGIESAMNRFN